MGQSDLRESNIQGQNEYIRKNESRLREDKDCSQNLDECMVIGIVRKSNTKKHVKMNSWSDDLKTEISTCKQMEQGFKKDRLSIQNEKGRTTFDQNHVNRFNEIPTCKQIYESNSFFSPLFLFQFNSLLFMHFSNTLGWGLEEALSY